MYMYIKLILDKAYKCKFITGFRFVFSPKRDVIFSSGVCGLCPSPSVLSYIPSLPG